MLNEMNESELKSTHLKITALSSGGGFLDGYDLGIISVAVLLLKPEFLLSSLDVTLLLGSTLLGMVFGGISGGLLADRKGRKYLYMWDMLLFIAFTVLAAISTSFAEILVFRLLLGVAIGVDYAISPTIISEYAPAKQRGKLLTINGVFWFIGAAFSYFAGFLFSQFGDLGWRIMFLVGIIPAIMILVLRSNVPESPRWLISQGKVNEAKASFKAVVGNDPGEYEIGQSNHHLKDLFNKRYIFSTIFVLTFWFILDAATYAIALEGPTILETGFGLSVSGASGYASIIAMLAVIGAFLTFVFIDRSGRRFVTLVGFAGMTITLVLAALSLIDSLGVFIFLIIIVFFEILEEFGPGITSLVYPQELFPTSLRSTAQGLGTTVSRIGALVGIFSFSYFSSIYGYGGGLIFLAGLSLIALIFTLAFKIEPKGKTLENLTE